MKGIFVHQLSRNGVKYADAIVDGLKPIETRTRNMLGGLEGERVAIVRTMSGSVPTVIGYADLVRYEFCPYCLFEMYRNETLIPPGSRYDVSGRGKWFYHMANPERCEPYPLPSSAIRHGRSWCEF